MIVVVGKSVEFDFRHYISSYNLIHIMNNFSRMAACVLNFSAYKGLSTYCLAPKTFNKHNLRICSRSKHFLRSVQYKYSLPKGFSTVRHVDDLPKLTCFPMCMWPGLFTPFKVFFLFKYKIKPHFDNNFDKKQFDYASMHAVEVVSHILSEGKLNELEGLVAPEVLSEIRKNIKNFSLKQQMELAIDKRDIFACYTHNIGLIMPDSQNKFLQELTRERFVEITMAYHVLKGYKDINPEDRQRVFRPFQVPEFEKNLYVLSYRFIRDYSEGKNSDWIINGLNHFKPLAKYQ